MPIFFVQMFENNCFHLCHILVVFGSVFSVNLAVESAVAVSTSVTASVTSVAVAVTASATEPEEDGIGLSLGGGLHDLGVDEEGDEDGEENGCDVLHGDCQSKNKI